MTTSNAMKALLAGMATVALVGTAVAQGNPPTTASPNPATGAGQQSSQNTPMGTTGTSGGSNAGSASSAASGSKAGSSGTSGASMGASGAGDTSAAAGGTNRRPARADRN